MRGQTHWGGASGAHAGKYPPAEVSMSKVDAVGGGKEKELAYSVEMKYCILITFFPLLTDG